jgi:hypothetical protein
VTTRTSLSTIAFASVLVMLSGCTDKASPDNVDRRSVERWNFLIAHEAEKAWDYLTPGFRATQSREDYAKSMNSRPLHWKKAVFRDKKCDADRCKAQVDVTYALTIPGTNTPTETTSTQSETWILTDGAWFFLPN